MEEKRKKRVRTKRVQKNIKHTHKFGFLGAIFCPLEHNDHRPHLLRAVTLLAISVAAIFFTGVSFARYYFLHQTVLGQEIVSSVLIDLANETRQKYGESVLIRNQALENASRMKAEDMATYEYFAHNSPTGVTPWYWMKKAGYDFLYAGENLAIDFTRSSDVNDAWLKSPTHRANILNSKFKEIGISVKEGMIDGHNTIYVVQMFGTPKISKSAQDLIASQTISSTFSVSTSTQGDLSGEVAGAQIPENSEPVSTTNVSAENKLPVLKEIAITASSPIQVIPKEEYITLVNENNMIVVADREAIEEGRNIEEITNEFKNATTSEYSNFWQKFIFNFWSNLNLIYKILTGIILVSVLSLVFVDFKKQHWRYMLYGILTITLLLILLYLNQGLW